MKSHKKPFWKRVRTGNTATLLVTVTTWTGRKQFYFWILIELIFGYFILFIKNLYYKTIIRLRLSDYGEYSPRLRLGEYSPVITSPSANNC
jgi:hypothetical protein